MATIQPTPRGIRNRNPGNLRHGPAWQGLAARQDDPEFAVFETETMGIRAMGLNLQNYQRAQGVNTPRAVIERWAPPVENDTEAYIASVARKSGLDPDQPLDLSRDALPLVRAMIEHENGIQPYSDETIRTGLEMAGLVEPPLVQVAQADIGIETDDLGPSYLRRREQLAQGGALDRLNRRLGIEGSEPLPAPSGRPSEPERRPDRPQAGIPPEGLPGVSGGQISRVARDVGVGLLTSPTQAIGGVRDAAQEMWEMAGSFGDWMTEHVADLGRLGDEPWNLPEVGEPSTVTGGLVRGAAQFLVPFKRAYTVAKAAGMGSNIAAAMLAGAFTDAAAFDAHEKRLSDLWNEMGGPENMLTEWLAADPDDTEIEGRFKNAVEGFGLGIAGEAVFKGAHLLRAVRRARAQGKPPSPEEIETRRLTEQREAPSERGEAAYTEVTEERWATLGSASAPLVSREALAAERLGQAQAQVTRKLTEAGIGSPETFAETVTRVMPEGAERDIFINFRRIDAPQDVKDVLDNMAQDFAPMVQAERRGVQSFEETQRLADTLGMSVEDILKRNMGQPLNAEQALAARRLWVESSNQLMDAARKAGADSATEQDQFIFRRMMAVHAAVQAQVIGARTETARALSSWRIPAGGGLEQARAIRQIMDASGGPETSRQMARRLVMMAENGADAAAISAFTRKGWGATTMNVVKEVWINGLLSSPKTHLVNISSNMGVAMQQIVERAVAARIGGTVELGEAAAMTYGLVSGLRDAFRLAGKALRHEEAFDPTGMKIDIVREPAVTKEAFRLENAGGVGRAVDFMGSMVRLPGRFLGAEDAFFKSVGYRMELHAQALRQATAEGREGPDLYRRIAEIANDPPEHIRVDAADAAMYNTFTNKVGWFGQRVMNLRAVDKPWSPMFLILPFVRTPVNIARYSFERSPMAPLVGQWRADIAAGGARRDLALARMATGSTIMLLAADMADSGQVSGRGPTTAPEREAMLRTGWQPYSVKIGDRWYSYNRTDPFGMTMGFAADINEAFKRGQIDQEDMDEWQEVSASAIAAISQVTINKTYLRGIADFIEVQSDPTRYSPNYINNLVGSFTPLTSLQRNVARAVDPTLREVQNPADAIYAQIAGLSEKLPPRRDLWGRPIRIESGLGRTYDFFSPVAARTETASPIDNEMRRLNSGVARIPKKTSFMGVNVNFKEWPEVYDTYVRLAGNDLKVPRFGMVGTKDYLDAIVTGRHPEATMYRILSDGRDGGKIEFIKMAVRAAREAAQAEIARDPKFREFTRMINRRRVENMTRGTIIGEQLTPLLESAIP